MNRPSRFREAELALAGRSKRLAESQLRFVSSQRLAEAVADYVECRAFAYWVRLINEAEGTVSPEMKALLDVHCPGFLEYMASYHREHPREREFLWLRLISWIDDNIFGFAKKEGWPHALGYYAARDSRMDQVLAYWLHYDDFWKHQCPSPFPAFEEWRRAASTMKV